MEPLSTFLFSLVAAGILFGTYKFLEMKEQKIEQPTETSDNHED